MSVHDREPKSIGNKRESDLERSNMHLTPLFNSSSAAIEILLLAGYINIQPIPSALQSVF